MKHFILLLLITVLSMPLLADTNDIGLGDIFGVINLNDMEAVATMLRNDKEAVLATRTNNGITPLHYAASLDATEAAHRLLDAGVEVNIQTDGSLTTPLHWAADTGASDTLRYLLSRGADVNATAKNGYTALHFLARGTVDPGLARYLLEAGADINAADVRGNTPLHTASVNGNVRAVEYLINAKAKTDTKNHAGQLAVEIAKDEATQLAFGSTAPSLKPEKPHAVASLPNTEKNAPTEVQPSPSITTPKHEDRPSDTNVNSAANMLAVGEEYRQFMNDPDAIQNPDGSVYKGELRDGEYHGYGTLCFANRERYQGEWRRGLRHGVGTFTYSSGDIYNGEWRNHVPHGGGVFLYANGGKVNGTWKRGVLIEGDGFYVSADGSKFRAVWRDGKLLDSQPMTVSSNTL